MSAKIEDLLYQKLAYASALMGKSREDFAPEMLRSVAKDMAKEIEEAVLEALNGLEEKHAGREDDEGLDGKEVAEAITKVFKGSDSVT